MAKTWLRQMQDEMMNQGWRIPFIPWHDSEQTIRYPTNVPALIGAVLFVAGIGGCLFCLVMLQQEAGALVGLGVAVVGVLVGLASLWWKARRRRRSWLEVEAHCLDREVRQVRRVRVRQGPSWEQRILCQFELSGTTYRVTPIAHFSTFRSEQSATAFLDRCIGPDGRCLLWVNPDNPLETELVSLSFKDWLLH